MATVKVEQSSINELKSAITFAAEQTSQAANIVSKAIDGMSGMSFLAKPRLESELTSLKNRLNQQVRLSQSYCRAVQETVDALTQVDDSAGSSSEGVWSKTSAIVGAAVGSAVAAGGLSLATQDRMNKQSGPNVTFINGTPGLGSSSSPNITFANNTSSSDSSSGPNITFSAQTSSNSPNVSWNAQGSGSVVASSGSSSSANSGTLPSWAKESQSITSEYFGTEDGRGGQVCTYNTFDRTTNTGQVSCTFYTLRKLRERGLGYPFKTAGANGSQWYNNCIDSVSKAAGNSSIETLVAQNGGTLNNVVVSFPATANNPAGHVMLIDKVFKDPSTGRTMVSFSDNYDWGTHRYLTDPNGYTTGYTWSLDDFKATYIKENGGINGAVLIGS